MKKQFQSKSVPRGTRTIWRYLSALFLLFSLSIGQMWAETFVNLRTVDFTEMTQKTDFVNGKNTISDAGYTDLEFYQKATTKPLKLNNSVGEGIDFSGQNIGNSHLVAIPLTGINGQLKVTIYHKYSSGKASFKLGLNLGKTTVDPSHYSDNQQTPKDAANADLSCSYTYGADVISTTTTAVLFVGEAGSSYTQIKKVVIETLEASAPSVPVTSITITDPADLSNHYVGDQVTLEATVLPENATDKTLNWTMDVSDKATIADGKITFTEAGDFHLTATAADGSNKSNTVHLFVTSAPEVCPAGLEITGTHAYSEGETISLNAGLAAGNGDITYTWYKGADFATAKAAGSIGTGASFSKASCETGDAGYYWCEATKTSCEPAHNGTEFVVSVDPLVACAELVPATSGDAPAAGDAINLTTATGGSMQALSTNLTYTANGLQFGTNSGTKASVTLNHLMQETTVISVTLVANGTGARGLKLYDAAGSNQVSSLGWSSATNGEEKTFTYTVTGTDKLNGTNGFQLWRNNTVTLKSLQVFNCGAALLDLNSAVDPVGEATVTLSATKVAAGGSATATYSIADPTAYDFDEWVISSGDATIADAHAATAAITMGTTASVITLKLKAASTKHTVTYYDENDNNLGEELVVEGQHPVGLSIAPRKLGYTFAGWGLSKAGPVVAFNEVTVNADMPLYTIWNEIDCSAQSGTIFSVILNKPQAENCTIRSGSGYETEADLIKYGTVSGGIALAKNSSTSNHIVITTDPKLRLLGGNGKVHIQFDCALQEGDKIRTTIENQNIAYTTSDSRSTTNYFTKGTDQELTITSGHALENATEIYLWSASSSDGRLISLEVIRPEKLAVTFNMHGHGDQVDPQSVVEGGKVTEPADPTASGWDFGGWFTDDTYGTYWDFENMTISAATEIHALWTAHTTSSDATLSSLSYTIGGGDPIAIPLVTDQYAYAVELPMGTDIDAPVIAAVANDPNAKEVEIVQTNLGVATVTVTAEDNSTIQSYAITFSVATSKAIQLVFKTGTTPCVGSASTATQILSNNAAVSTYINQITFTNVPGEGDNGAEGTSLNVGKKAGNMFTLSAKAGYAFQAMNFLAKIQDATCEYSINGGDWAELASTSTSTDECYAPFTSGTVHEFRLRSTGASGVWIRNMQLTMIEACTPVAITWDEEPIEFEVASSTPRYITATANTGNDVEYSSDAPLIIAIDAVNGILSIGDVGSATISASTVEGDGTTFCENGGADIVISKLVKTYHLVTLDALNGETPAEIKYYGDAAIAQPADPVYAGHSFQGWLDESDAPVVWPLTPTVSMALHASWTADCTAPTIDVQPASANYLTGRAAVALNCEATAAGSGALSYVWYSCDDELRTNPIELAGAPTPSTAAAGTFYFFCAVTEEGCANVANSNVAVITVTDKDAICLVKAELAAGSSAASITSTSGYYKDDANIAINVAKDLKLGGTGKYVKVAVEGTNFRDGDVVEITLASDKTASAWLQIFSDEGTTLVAEMTSGVTREHPNYLTISGVPANTKTLYLYRTEAAGGNMNPYPTSMAVYRTSAPILNSVTVAGVEAAPDNTNHVAIEVPASTDAAALDAIVYNWVSNSDAWTEDHAPAVANAWEWGVENTLTFADKDGDESVYYVTISKAVPSSDATLSALSYGTPATAIALADGVYTYDVELPYGTSDVPALAATKNHVGATIVSISDAAAFVDRKATSTVTVKAEDATTIQVYTVNFAVSRYESKLLWDGSTMTALSEITAAATAAGVSVTTTGISVTSFSAKTCEENGKSYPRALDFGGKTQSTRYFGIEIPAGKVAKVSLVYRAKSTGRSIMVATALSSAIDESTITSKEAVDGSNLYVMKADMFGGGTLYINTTDGFHVHEISIQLADGFARSAMLGNGVLGTVCVDHNVAVEDIQGVTVYELVGREPQYGKVAFDEIISGELEAGAPYVFQAHGNHMALLYGETSVAEPVDKGNGMYGTFVDQTLTELDDVYYFAQRALWSCVDLTELSLPANRAYVKLSEIDYISDPNPAPGRRRVMMSVNGKNTPTALDEIRQEQSANSQKLLINGQLFILRGEKMYDATGRLVK